MAISTPKLFCLIKQSKRAKIVEPMEAVKGMKEFLKKASEMYEDDGKM